MFGRRHTEALERQLSEARHRVVTLERELELQSVREPVTGLLTLGAFDQRLVEELSRCQRYERPLTVGVLELTAFRHLRLRHGEQVIDDVLRATAVALGNGLRTSDVTARIGAGEFLLMLPETSGSQAQDACERIVRQLSEHSVGPVDSITACVGLASFAAGDGPQELMASAGSALDTVKVTGVPRVKLWEGAARPTLER